MAEVYSGELSTEKEPINFGTVIIPVIKGDTGEGRNLEFVWQGTSLGVRLEGEETYQFVDLKGEQGIQGEQGEQGIQGVAGSKGDVGLIGPTGLSAYEVALENGYEGTEQEWLLSLKGNELISDGMAEGENITLNDSGNLPIQTLKICGNTYQNVREGYNLFDKNNVLEPLGGAGTSYVSSDYIPAETGDRVVKNNATAIFLYNYEKSLLGQVDAWADKTITLENVQYIRFNVLKTDLDTIMLVKNMDMPDYEEFGVSPSIEYPSEVETVTGENEIKFSNSDSTEQQNYPISLGENEIFEDGYLNIEYEEKIGIKKITGASIYNKFGKYIFTGDEQFVASSYSNDEWICVYSYNDLVDNIKSDGKMYATRFKRIGSYTEILDENCIRCAKQLNMRISVNYLSENSTDGLKQLIKKWYDAGTPLKVVYELDTPTTSQITDETLLAQLEALINAETYKYITYIDTTTDNLKPYLKIGYGLAKGLMSDEDKEKINAIQVYEKATSTSDGLMSAEDKTKLDNIEGTVLFDGSSYTSITLNDDYSNYDYLEIYTRDTTYGDNQCHKVRTDMLTKKLSSTFYRPSDNIFFFVGLHLTWTNSKTITIDNAVYSTLSTSVSAPAAYTAFRIVKIIGYK